MYSYLQLFVAICQNIKGKIIFFNLLIESITQLNTVNQRKFKIKKQMNSEAMHASHPYAEHRISKCNEHFKTERSRCSPTAYIT